MQVTKERLDAIGGSLQIKNMPEKDGDSRGTAVEIKVPIAEAY